MFRLLTPYRSLVALLIVLGLVGNLASLILPGLIGQGINVYSQHHGLPLPLVEEFLAAVLVIAVAGSLQNVVQVYAAERVARDLRSRLSQKISRQTYSFVVERDPARLLTNLTSDVDAVKLYVSQVIASLLSSVVVLCGAGVLLIRLNPKLGLGVLSILPLIGMTFSAVLKRTRPMFEQSRAVLDTLNKVIQESIVGAALIRVLNAHAGERDRFGRVNTEARDLGLKILGNFALMIPSVTFFANMGVLIILVGGGRMVLTGQMELGDIAAFNSYLAMLIFPIFVIGFMGNLISQAQASYKRLEEVLSAPDPVGPARTDEALRGEVDVKDVRFSFGDKEVLHGVSLHLEPGSRNAIVGPTAAGKTQLLTLMCGLLAPDSGSIIYDGKFPPEQLRRQVAMVFQESTLFSGTLKDNIAFHPEASSGGWQRAIEAAELDQFVKGLPAGLETPVSERGTTLSGGQRQRVTLARALALEPSVLLLDDFTARLDPATEARVRENLVRLYPTMTILAVTQRIATIADYDTIFFMMEGEILARGSHAELLESSPEYAQLYESQKSTHHYE